MDIRFATPDDIEDIAYIESRCFPAAEAASISAITERVGAYPDHFWLCFENDTLVSYIGGLVTDTPDLTDDMFADVTLHNENGAWQMLFSVCTHPIHQGKGLASYVMKKVIADCKVACRKGIVLTCKEELLTFYLQFGFVNEGVSSSQHGGALWYQLRLTL